MLSGNPLFTSASAKASAFENKEAVELWIAFKNTDHIYPLYDEVRAKKGWGLPGHEDRLQFHHGITGAKWLK
jgi:hypothetical protein